MLWFILFKLALHFSQYNVPVQFEFPQYGQIIFLLIFKFPPNYFLHTLMFLPYFLYFVKGVKQFV